MTRIRKKPVTPSVTESAAPVAAVEAEAVLSDAAPQAEPPERTIRCVICNSVTQAGSPEHMCWVCRRLKISAWREVEQQIPAQE